MTGTTSSILVATFGPSTQWADTRITWDGRDFVLAGHGPVAPQDVMHYDAQGWLVWADEGTRAWVGARAAAGAHAHRRPEGHPGRSQRAKGILVVVIGALLVFNLVLLVILANTVDLL